MLFISTSKVIADPLGQFPATEQPVGLHHPAFGMDPARFYGVEPGAFGGQEAGQNPYPRSCPFDLTVVLLDPALDLLANVPGGIVPHQEQRFLTQSFQLATDPGQERDRHPADGTTLHKAQPDLLGWGVSGPPAHQQPITSQGFGVRVILGHRLLYQRQRLASLGPGVHPGASQPAEPTLILEAQGPVRMGGRQENQPISGPFFRAYAGSGLVIHSLARCQRVPRRARVARMVSPLTRWGVNPCWKLTSAANSRVHRLVGLSKVRGLWCNKARNCSAFSPGKAAWIVWGREDPLLRLSKPARLNARMALRAVCSSQPRWWAIWGARSPRALASRIWQRRRTKASAERQPASRCWRSASVTGRTKIGGIMPCIVIHPRIPCLNMHQGA